MITSSIDASLNYVGFQGDFTFDERICTFSAPFVEQTSLTLGNWSVLGNILPTPPGPIRILRVSGISLDLVPLSGSGTLYNLKMQRTGSAPGSNTPLTWQPAPDNFLFDDLDLNTHDATQVNGLITLGASGTPPPTPTPTPFPTPSPPNFFVTSTDDSGPGSLRQALGDAHDGDVIGFQNSIWGQTITLTTAELLIDKNVTITGPGPSFFLGVSRDQQAPNFRIFHVMPGHIAAISGLTISGGRVQNENGAGIYDDHATLTISNSTISGNVTVGTVSPGAGGAGIYSTGNLSLVNSAVSGNSASGGWSAGGGGIYIYNTGTATITQSFVSSNSADFAGWRHRKLGDADD